jgi:methionyl-tRNA formyltransferase
VNNHPAFLPRHRGPYPLAWTFREGDAEFGATWHRMDAEFDTGPILAQSKVPLEDTDCWIEEFAPKILQNSLSMLPAVFERLEAGDPGDPQSHEGVSWAGPFEEDYATVDWSQSAREIHNQVRAWRHLFGAGDVEGPIAELDGERLKLLRTSLTDPGEGVRVVECGDGPIWVVETEPAATESA